MFQFALIHKTDKNYDDIEFIKCKHRVNNNIEEI